MRITDSKPVAEARRSSKAARSGATIPFFVLGETGGLDDEPVLRTRPATLAGVGDISVLLAVQSYENRRRQKREAVRNAGHTLDALDALKLDLLSGRVSPQRLEQIAALSSRERQTTEEPELDGILAHIELRARVELAKLEARRR